MDQINIESDVAGIPRFGKTYLFDGGTGENLISQPLLVLFILAGHLIDDNDRSIGLFFNYSTTIWR